MVSDRTGLRRRKRGGELGNLNALKHGFYSNHFQREELSDLEAAGNLEEELGMMRVVTRRLLGMARGCKDTQELIQVLGALGMAATRVAGLMRTEKFIGHFSLFDEELEAAIAEISKDWKVG